jgi:hypothetical protein
MKPTTHEGPIIWILEENARFNAFRRVFIPPMDNRVSPTLNSSLILLLNTK